ncbi:hypothetical protein C4J81_13625 [Deltaproteobacteria bacterium Smac51]|nr:hypothetical protein C4J81_13625 [Deltaproteobacteria bacterium Smac51]
MTARLVLAKNIRLIRDHRGFSQERLGEMSYLHRTYISSVECGNRNISVDAIERIAIALGVNIQILFDEDLSLDGL